MIVTVSMSLQKLSSLGTLTQEVEFQMLVIISDLHLTDGTSGETIRAAAFKAFRERFRDLAYDASWRSDDEYRPLESIDLVLLGDILDVIRSTRWCDAPADVRPWGRQDDPRFAAMVINRELSSRPHRLPAIAASD